MLRKSIGNIASFAFSVENPTTPNNAQQHNTGSRNANTRSSLRSNNSGSARSNTNGSRRNSLANSRATRNGDEINGRLTPTSMAPAPVLRNSVILQQAKIKNIIDFILYFIKEQRKQNSNKEEILQESYTDDEGVSLQQIENIIVDSGILYEASIQDQTAIQVMDEYVSLLKAIHMNYSEWFDFVIIRSKDKQSLTKEEFTREIVRMCQDIRRPPMEGNNITILFEFIFNAPLKKIMCSNNDHSIPEEPALLPAPLPLALALEKQHFDIAFERHQMITIQLRKLTVAASHLRSLGAYMKQNDIALVDIANSTDDLQVIDDACIPASRLDVLLTSLVARYDAYVYEHGTPVDYIENIAANFGQLNSSSGGDGNSGSGGIVPAGGPRRRQSRLVVGNAAGMEGQMLPPVHSGHELHHPVPHAQLPSIKRVISEDMDESPAELKLLQKHHKSSYAMQRNNSFKQEVTATVSSVIHSIGNMASNLTKQFAFNHNTVTPEKEGDVNNQQTATNNASSSKASKKAHKHNAEDDT